MAPFKGFKIEDFLFFMTRDEQEKVRLKSEMEELAKSVLAHIKKICRSQFQKFKNIDGDKKWRMLRVWLEDEPEVIVLIGAKEDWRNTAVSLSKDGLRVFFCMKGKRICKDIFSGERFRKALEGLKYSYTMKLTRKEYKQKREPSGMIHRKNTNIPGHVHSPIIQLNLASPNVLKRWCDDSQDLDRQYIYDVKNEQNVDILLVNGGSELMGSGAVYEYLTPERVDFFCSQIKEMKDRNYEFMLEKILPINYVCQKKEGIVEIVADLIIDIQRLIDWVIQAQGKRDAGKKVS